MHSEEPCAPEPPPPITAHLQSNGVNRCGKCGASEVRFDGSWLVCTSCRHRWNTAVLADELKLSDSVESLVGTWVFGGARDVDTSSLVTVECSGCGASVTINSELSLTASCHWCRHALTLNNPVANGAVPDAILPFFVTREDAATRMAAYIGDQGKFAKPEFRHDFDQASIRAVYLPYLVVDGNVTVRLSGRAWAQGRGWTAGSRSEGGRDREYISDEYAVTRETDLLVDDLAIEARSTRSKLHAAVSTTNIINAIQPFDVKNAVRFNANYITEGIAFEKRDTEVSGAMGEAANLFATIARGYVNQTLQRYDGGVRWESEVTAIKGTRWVTALLPVWLYGFEENTPTGPMMHYLAVNGRTGETEGSIPTDEAHARRSGRRWGLGAAILYEAVFGAPGLLIAGVFAAGALTGDLHPLAGVAIGLFGLSFAAPGLAVAKGVAKWRRNMIAQGQRKAEARLKPESETTYTPTRLERNDEFLGTFTHLGGPEIEGRNDYRPHARAAQFRFVLGDLPEPAVEEKATADFAWDTRRGLALDERGRSRAGQGYAAAPLGSRVTRQLIPGWRDS